MRDKVKAKEYMRAWRSRNEERRRSYMHAWTQRDTALFPEKNREQCKRYRTANLEQCRAKERAYAAQARLSNPDWARNKYNKWSQENPDARMFIGAKQRAKKRGLAFDIELEDVVIPRTCPLLGIPLVVNRGQRKPSNNSPSLDRIDPTKGYVKGNVWVISYRANKIKNDASLEELELLVSSLRAGRV